MSILYFVWRLTLGLIRLFLFMMHLFVRHKADRAQSSHDELAREVNRLIESLTSMSRDYKTHPSVLLAASCREQLRLARLDERCRDEESRWSRWQARSDRIDGWRSGLRPASASWLPWMAAPIDVTLAWNAREHLGIDPVEAVAWLASAGYDMARTFLGMFL